MAATAAPRTASRYLTRRLSGGGKILSEEEKAAENVYIKKVEQEKLEKLARKGVKAEEQPPTAMGTSATGAMQSHSAGSSTSGVSTDENRNYAVLAGTVAALAGFGWWYLGTRSKKPAEVQD